LTLSFNFFLRSDQTIEPFSRFTTTRKKRPSLHL